MRLDCVPAICVEQVVVTCDSAHVVPSMQCVRVQDAVHVNIIWQDFIAKEVEGYMRNDQVASIQLDYLYLCPIVALVDVKAEIRVHVSKNRHDTAIA